MELISIIYSSRVSITVGSEVAQLRPLRLTMEVYWFVFLFLRHKLVTLELVKNNYFIFADSQPFGCLSYHGNAMKNNTTY